MPTELTLPVWYLLTLAVLSGCLGATLVAERCRLANERWHQARRDACTETARARAAERPYRRRLSGERRPIACVPFPRTPAAPTATDLAAWEIEVGLSGAPWLYASDGSRADVRCDVDGGRRIVLRRPTTGQLRALVAA